MSDLSDKNDLDCVNSLFENIMNDTISQMKFVEDFYKSSPQFSDFINNPTISLEEKYGLLDHAFHNDVSKRVLDLLKSLVEDKSFQRIFNISKEFSEVYSSYSRVLKVTVISSKELTQNQYDKIAEKISKETAANVKIVKSFDKSLIGGVIIEYDGKRLDGSIKAKLDKLNSIVD